MKNDSWLFPEDLPFDGLFDLDGDGKVTGMESLLRDDHWLDMFEDKPKKRISDRLKEEGAEYCIYPENYNTVDEFKEALHEAKYGWRFFVDLDDVVLVDPEDYETEEEYEEALEKAKHGWRNAVDLDDAVKLDPVLYETKEEYEEALEEEKYGWRDDIDFDDADILDPDLFETEEDYLDALEEEKYGWRDKVSVMDKTYADPYDYETEEDFKDAVKYEKSVSGVDDYDRASFMFSYDDDDDDDEDIDPDELDPDDFESEAEYDYAVARAHLKLAQKITKKYVNSDEDDEDEDDDDGEEDEDDRIDSDEISPESFPNKRRYEAAVALARDWFIHDEERAACKLIAEKADTLIAANYMTQYGQFLYSQAVKDHFDLPCSLPDEDSEQKMKLDEIVFKVSRYDCELAARIWAWCLENFGPYRNLSEYSAYQLTGAILSWFDSASDPAALKRAVVQRMAIDPAFCKNVVVLGDDCSSSLSELIVAALHEKEYKTAELLFATALEGRDSEWSEINELILFTIDACADEESTDSMIYFRDHLFPHVRKLKDGMVLDEIPVFEEKMAEFINGSDDDMDAFAQGIRAAIEDAVPPLNIIWKNHPSGKADADTAFDRDDNLPDYDMEFEKEAQEKAQKRAARQNESDALIEAYEDKRIYTLCNIMLRVGSKPYCFLTDDATIKIGDRVVVEVGKENREETGTVVSVGQYLRYAAPYPIEKTKKILRKVEA